MNLADFNNLDFGGNAENLGVIRINWQMWIALGGQAAEKKTPDVLIKWVKNALKLPPEMTVHRVVVGVSFVSLLVQHPDITPRMPGEVCNVRMLYKATPDGFVFDGFWDS